MYVYELLPKLTYLTLAGQDDGELLFIGTFQQWQQANNLEEKLCSE
jgi:hypothetical protein